MISSDSNSSTRQSKKSSEIILVGRAVSRGSAVGRVVCLHGRKRQFFRLELKKAQIDSELRRFYSAAQLAKNQIQSLIERNSKINNQKKNDIFETHLLLIEDKLLLTKIENIIKVRKINAEWALKLVTDEYIKDIKSISDEHLSDRYIDIEDVTERLQNALGGYDNLITSRLENLIIVAKDVKPSTLIELASSNPKAIITERGGWTSHTYILARELSIPAVTGLKDVLRNLQTNDEVIVDGFNGSVVLHPKMETLEKYQRETIQIENNDFRLNADGKIPLTTLDGRKIIIRANADFPEGYAKAKLNGAVGIGLYRSEFLFNQFKGFPTEAEQIKAYKNIAQTVGDDAMRIRTFDLTVEQATEEIIEKEPNPALGMRGIRLSLSKTEKFRIQIRALLQVAGEYKIEIILPMISDISEIFQTKAILEQEEASLRKQNIKYGNPRIGVMIEVPATIFMIEEIADAIDFICLGTNDLVQYLLAVDRDNEAVADWFRTLHPSVLRAVKKVLDTAYEKEIPALVCGEMAGSPVYAAVLVGLGATELSMNPNSILRVRNTISAIAFEEAREIANRLLQCKTSDLAEQLVFEFFTKNWSHLFTSEDLPESKNKI